MKAPSDVASGLSYLRGYEEIIILRSVRDGISFFSSGGSNSRTRPDSNTSNSVWKKTSALDCPWATAARGSSIRLKRSKTRPELPHGTSEILCSRIRSTGRRPRLDKWYWLCRIYLDIRQAHQQALTRRPNQRPVSDQQKRAFSCFRSRAPGRHATRCVRGYYSRVEAARAAGLHPAWRAGLFEEGRGAGSWDAVSAEVKTLCTAVSSRVRRRFS